MQNSLHQTGFTGFHCTQADSDSQSVPLSEVNLVIVLMVSLSESVGVPIFLGVSKGTLSSQSESRPVRSFLVPKNKHKPSKQDPVEEAVGIGESLIRWMAVTSILRRKALPEGFLDEKPDVSEPQPLCFFRTLLETSMAGSRIAF